jgi:hypothetical protein
MIGRKRWSLDLFGIEVGLLFDAFRDKDLP